MTKSIFYLLCCCAFSCLAQDDPASLKQEAMAKAKHFATQLKSTLQAGVKQGGLV